MYIYINIKKLKAVGDNCAEHNHCWTLIMSNSEVHIDFIKEHTPYAILVFQFNLKLNFNYKCNKRKY